MFRSWDVLTTALLTLLVATVLLAVGCGSDTKSTVYQNISERASWSVLGRIAFASFGGNGRLYINAVNVDGGGLSVLTPSDNDSDFADEGGRHPAFSPNGRQLAIASRRGASEGIFLIDAETGDRNGIIAVTDASAVGADNQPSFNPDGNQILFTSTRRAGNGDIYLITRPGAAAANAKADAREPVVATEAEEQWAVMSPDGTKIAYQSDFNGNTDIWVKAVGSDPLDPGTCLTAASPYRDEAPCWSPDGARIFFHSNRNGDFDIWMMDADGSNQVEVTADQRSDGFPWCSPNGQRLLITRDRELWTIPAAPWTTWRANADTESVQITRRY